MVEIQRPCSKTGCSAVSIRAPEGQHPVPRFREGVRTADTPADYTVRNLSERTAYTVCFTADDNGSNLNPTPATATFTTAAMTSFDLPGWGSVGNSGFSDGTAYDISLAFAPDSTPYVAFMDGSLSSKATVMKYVDFGASWVLVGSPGFF
ncbi:MAG: hypothetical protein WCL08_08700, partial [Verrucomicrobiota bacterium]